MLFLVQKDHITERYFKNYMKNGNRPGDSIRDLFSPDGRRSPFQPLSSGHVFTHHPKKVTNAESPGIIIRKPPKVKRPKVLQKGWRNA